MSQRQFLIWRNNNKTQPVWSILILHVQYMWEPPLQLLLRLSASGNCYVRKVNSEVYVLDRLQVLLLASKCALNIFTHITRLRENLYTSI